MQKAFVDSPCVDFLLDFSVEKELEEARKNRRCQQRAYFSLETVEKIFLSVFVFKKFYLMLTWLPVYTDVPIIHCNG